MDAYYCYLQIIYLYSIYYCCYLNLQYEHMLSFILNNYLLDMDASSSQRRNRGKKHQWNAEQDAILIGCLLDLKNDPM